MKLHKIVNSYSDRGIVSLSNLKRKNVYLYRYLVTNKGCWENFDEVYILDDIALPISQMDTLKYLQYYFGGTVNMSELLITKQRLYRKILEHKHFLVENGIKLTYDTKSADFVLREEVVELLNKGVTTSKFPKSIRSKIEYRARKLNMSFREYLSFLIDGGDCIDTGGESSD